MSKLNRDNSTDQTGSTSRESSTLGVCAGCSLLCDDISFSAKVPDVKGCQTGADFYEIEAASSSFKVAGENATFGSAVEAASKVLGNSKAPLVCGLDQLTMQAQIAAWKVAERIGAAVDTTLSNHGRASMFALQRTGKVTATLGEIASRSDLVIFWFCDPASTHPRLLQRLGNTKRKIVVFDESATETARAADHFFQVDSAKAASVLAGVIALVGDVSLSSDQLARIPLVLEDLNRIVSEISSAKYGSIFFGQPTRDSQFDLSTDLVHSLIRKLNDVTRFVGQKLRTDSNTQSGEDVLAWSSGFPFAINYAQGGPRFNWLEYSTETLLERGECDSILIASGLDLQTTFAGLSRIAKSHLNSIPKVILSPIEGIEGDVSFVVGVAGVNESGDWVRNDGVALPVTSLKENGEVSANEIFEKMLECLTVTQR